MRDPPQPSSGASARPLIVHHHLGTGARQPAAGRPWRWVRVWFVGGARSRSCRGCNVIGGSGWRKRFGARGRAVGYSNGRRGGGAPPTPQPGTRGAWRSRRRPTSMTGGRGEWAGQGAGCQGGSFLGRRQRAARTARASGRVGGGLPTPAAAPAPVGTRKPSSTRTPMTTGPLYSALRIGQGGAAGAAGRALGRRGARRRGGGAARGGPRRRGGCRACRTKPASVATRSAQISRHTTIRRSTPDPFKHSGASPDRSGTATRGVRAIPLHGLRRHRPERAGRGTRCSGAPAGPAPPRPCGPTSSVRHSGTLGLLLGPGAASRPRGSGASRGVRAPAAARAPRRAPPAARAAADAAAPLPPSPPPPRRRVCRARGRGQLPEDRPQVVGRARHGRRRPQGQRVGHRQAQRDPCEPARGARLVGGEPPPGGEGARALTQQQRSRDASRQQAALTITPAPRRARRA
jgi:hypothetical protein